jgi:hypothetical protein
MLTDVFYKYMWQALLKMKILPLLSLAAIVLRLNMYINRISLDVVNAND